MYIILFLFLWSYETEFIQEFLEDAQIEFLFYFNFRYIDDILKLNNPEFSVHVNIVSRWTSV